MIYQQLKKGMNAEAQGVFLVEGILGLDMGNVKEGMVKPWVPENISFKARIKTRFRTIEIEAKNSKFKVR